MRDGVNWRILRELAKAKDLDALARNWENELALFIKLGLLRQEGEYMRLTPDGMLVSNQVYQIFV
jgi:coproporphyrinogen III oxidase-like Fe-S oxidoreductase